MSLNFRKTGARIFLLGLVCWCILWSLSVWLNLNALPWMGWLTLLLAAGCIRYDLTLHTKTSGAALQRFLRNALIVAYAWFLLAAFALIGYSRLPGAVQKDVVFHLLGLGFIFTMILAHAPLILPAAIGKTPPHSAPVLFFVLFQLLTFIRIMSDLLVTEFVAPWVWSGWITGVLHLAAFVAYMVTVFRQVRKPAIRRSSR
jgi:hypothetical protein